MFGLEDYAKIICGVVMAMMVLGLGSAVVMPGLDRWIKNFFIVFFSCLVLFAAGFMVSTLAYVFPSELWVLQTCDLLISLFASALYPLLTVLMLHCGGEDWRHSSLLRGILALWGLFLLLLVFSGFTDVFGYTGPDKEYVIGPLYPLLLLPMIALLLVNLAAVFRRRNRLRGKYFPALLVALLPLSGVLLLHTFVTVFPLVDVGVALSGMAMYVLITSEQMDRFLRQQREIVEQERELTRQQANIMVLQMRPHFIFNTMTSIYLLCKKDPEAARRVIMDFTTYLRKNFNAIAVPGTIPFAEELEHTRAYLDVERVQFEGQMFVDFDTPCTVFRLPPLTLQPIVENSVKHGLDPESQPLRITVRTRRTARGAELTVEDNGRGFGPEEDGKPHVTLANIRQRLRLMCSGDMEIRPREGGGTTVTVTVPDSDGSELTP